MKIAVCGRFNTDKSHQGGSAEVFLELGKQLSKDNDVTLFGRGKPTKKIIEMCRKNKIKYHYIPSDNIINILLGPLRALKLLRKNWDNFDIIHTHTGSFAWASTFFKKESKIITHIHEISIPNKNSIPVTTYMHLQNFLLEKASKKSDLVITVSDYMVKLIKDRWGITNVISIPNGADRELFNPSKKNNRLINFYNKTDNKLLFVGRLTRRKGILDLLKSFNEIKDKNYKLLIIGDGELAEIVNEKIKNNPRIRSYKYINKNKLGEYYTLADMVIVPSHYEPGALVPREALSCGTPILVSNNTGLKEIKPAKFLKGDNLRDIAKSIIRGFNSKPSRKKCREYALENYDWKKITKVYEKEYKRLLKK